jgi:hypothetical protein
LTDQVSSKDDFIGWCAIKFGNTTGALVSARYLKLQPPVDPAYPDGDHTYWCAVRPLYRLICLLQHFQE